MGFQSISNHTLRTLIQNNFQFFENRKMNYKTIIDHDQEKFK